VPRDVVALVSADDFVSAIRVYADRINDLLRRGGVPAFDAIDISETQALALLDALIDEPETVIDLAGWWFARAMDAINARASRATEFATIDEPVSLLAGTDREQQVRAALAALPEPERTAIVLRDAYDLPPQAVGVALGLDTQTASTLIASGRLGLVSAYDSRAAPDLSGHTGRTTVDVVSLSRLADGTLESPWAAPLRRHAANCPACEEMVETLARGRRLAAGLPIIAMDDDVRAGVLNRVGARADAELPSADEIQRAIDDDRDPGPPISPVFAVVVLVLALALGIAVAVVTRSDKPSRPAAAPTASSSPASSPSAAPSTTPTLPGPIPTLTPSLSPSASASPKRSKRPHHSPSPTPSKSATAPTTGPSLTLAPSHGPSGTTVTVRGGGWQPGTTVTLTYGHTGSTASATVDSHGRFVANLVATAVLPGAEEITVRDGSKSAEARFNQTL
jgi:DNA-directed RNA polymerase specialized sigma24 family protein